jgi:O-antigen ligase
MNAEYIVNRISMVSLIIAGAIFIYQGIKYINMKKTNPDLSDKLYVAGVFALILGVVEVAFGVYHVMMPTK